MSPVDDLECARRRLRPLITPTRVVRLPHADHEVFLKAEHEQVCGSFKARGAWNAVLALGVTAVRHGLVTGSSGNHGLALATAAGAVGTSAVVVMPYDCPPGKRALVENAGAHVLEYDPRTAEREEVVSLVAEREGRVVVPSADHQDVVSGAATVAVELLDQVTGLDLIVVPVGGGGLAAGTCLAVSRSGSGCQVVGVEPRSGDDTLQSLERGVRVRIPPPRTVADGLRRRIPGPLTFPVIRRFVDRIVLVDDHEILSAMRCLRDRLGIRAEPSGACALAGVLSGRLDAPRGSRIGVVVSGGSITADEAEALLGHGP